MSKINLGIWDKYSYDPYEKKESDALRFSLSVKDYNRVGLLIKRGVTLTDEQLQSGMFDTDDVRFYKRYIRLRNYDIQHSKTHTA